MNSAGSPLLARQNPQVYLIILYLLIAIIIIFAVYVVLKIIQKLHSTPEYIETQKSKITVYKNVVATAKKIQLTKEETLLLWKTCKYTKALNIFYTHTDINYVDEIFKTYFQHKKRHNASDEVIYELLKLRFKIFKYVTFSKNLPSSRNIPIGTVLSYPAPSGFFYQFKLEKNEKNGLYLSIPETLDENNKDRPEKLIKIALIFSLQSDQQYVLATRVVQYLSLPENKNYLVISHTGTICPQSRRTSQRFIVNKDCLFSAVDVTEKENGEKILKAKPSTHKGILIDISEGGCKLFTDLPIKKMQYIHLSFDINGQNESLYGLIVDTKTDLDTGYYALHIAFKNYPIKTRVKLLADLYNYN